MLLCGAGWHPAADWQSALPAAQKCCTQDQRLRARSLLSRILLIGVADSSTRKRPVMNQHPIPKRYRLSLRNRPRSVLILIARKLPQPERIRRKQAIGARVPGCRVTKALGVVEYGNTHRLAGHRSRIVHPVSRFAPDRLLALRAVGTNHMV